MYSRRNYNREQNHNKLSNESNDNYARTHYVRIYLQSRFHYIKY